MANLSQQKRQKMLDFLNKIRAEHQDDETRLAINEIENALNEKKYGLVWEEHTERVDDEIIHNIPIFTEDKDRKIKSIDSNDYNFLIEGDNLHSLKLLEKTHKGKIDVIYIDPPYNTGNKDFIYDDSFVDKDDNFKHSKWVSFMFERLKIAEKLLNEKGVIFISIDDKEQAQLKLLCDEIFGENNFITNIHWRRSESQNNNAKQIAVVGEFILCYVKNKVTKLFNKIELQETALKEYRYIDEITNKKFRRGTIVDNSRGKNIFKVISPTGIEKEIKSIRTKEFFEEANSKDMIYWTKTGTPYLKLFLDKSEGQISNNWFDNVGVNEDSSELLKKLEIDFSFSKPISLIEKLLKISGNENIIVLDFFAGSGTTGHAVVQLNKEDGGNRKYILCTNNENNICEEVTYKRLKKIQEELPHNLKYLRTKFIPKFDENEESSIKNKMLDHIKELIELEYMCEIDGINNILIKNEDEFDEIVNEDLKENIRLFISSDIFASREQQSIIDSKNIEIIEIPEYYYKNELREVGEL